MQTLRNSLICLLLAALTLAALKFCFFLDQVSIVVDDGQSVIAQAGPQLIGAAMELRGAAREQRSYYKATGRALAIDMIRAGALIEHADTAVQRLDANSAPVLAAAGQLILDTGASQKALAADLSATVTDADRQVQANGEELRLALAAARGNFEQAEKIWPPLLTSAQSMTRSSDNVEQATDSIRIALEPLRKPTGRLQFVLHWLLGLPHVNIR
jgi:hypothetical protein